ncbi:MAG: SDR family NAD(P)-dependent oxidoreductase [Pseudomonadales bacterium]|nr:SDR family NAD(P)-dependent oxidoreductase [Pseudomonadales bacterium]MCP5319823.1 SDR family NAD(P)-dependent oxidoreductase [Pseudomonadales bacterium]MCP5337919.1 SDR family NAD(P)-dependent oxidoreductase [Pseudomonadales bacterium]
MQEAAEFAARYGRWALIAGGSEGIGRSFALQLAARGLHLILVARRAEPLQATAQEIRERFDVQVSVHSEDLTAPDLGPRIEKVVAEREVGMLVYNAGAVHGAGLLLDRALEDALTLVRLNCVGPLTLIHSLGARMRERRRGGIILMSSMSALGGVGHTAAYAATKAFERVLAEGLWWEFGTFGVDVLGLLAGATATPSMARSNVKFTGARSVADDIAGEKPGVVPMDPDDVAREALEHLGAEPIWIPGERNRAIAEHMAQAPRIQTIRRMSETSAMLYGLPVAPHFRD